MPLYKVATIPNNTPIENGRTASGPNLEITAAALTEDDRAFERFDTNLPLMGIVVVDIRLVNRAMTPLKSLSFTLQDATGKNLSRLDAKKTLKAIMNAEGVRLYAIKGREETLAQLQALALPKKVALSAQQELRGVLFFQAKRDVAGLRALTLTVKGDKQPITVNLLP